MEAAKRLQLAQAGARLRLLASSRGVLAEQQDGLAEQIRGYEAQQASAAVQRSSLNAQMESTRRLAQRGDVSRNTVRALERSLAELDGNSADFAARAAAMREQIAGTRQQIVQTQRQSVNEAAVALRDTQFQLNPDHPVGAAHTSRRVPSGIVFVNRDGLRWQDAPSEYGPHKTL